MARGSRDQRFPTLRFDPAAQHRKRNNWRVEKSGRNGWFKYSLFIRGPDSRAICQPVNRASNGDDDVDDDGKDEVLEDGTSRSGCVRGWRKVFLNVSGSLSWQGVKVSVKLRDSNSAAEKSFRRGHAIKTRPCFGSTFQTRVHP